jgi:hypothetical protein
MVNSWELKWSGLEGRFGNRVMHMNDAFVHVGEVEYLCFFCGGGCSFSNFLHVINAQNIEHI